MLSLPVSALQTALDLQVNQALQNAFAPGTRKNQILHQNRYIAFCQQTQYPIWPIEEAHLCRYACFLAQSLSTAEAISNYIQGIKNWALIQGQDITAFASSRLKLTLRGLRRQKRHLPRQALPITPNLLLQLRQTVLCLGKKGLVFWTLSLLAFFLSARKSNLVPDKPALFDPSKHLTRGDIVIHQDHLMVTFRWSKTIQFGQRLLQIPVRAINNSILCPVSAYTKMVQLMPGPPSLPAFVVPSPTGLAPFCYWQWMTQLKSSLLTLGLDSSKYSTHSFRRGGATFAYQAGVPIESIKLMGDWASDAVYKYVQFPGQIRWSAASKISEAVNTAIQ